MFGGLVARPRAPWNEENEADALIFLSKGSTYIDVSKQKKLSPCTSILRNKKGPLLGGPHMG